MLVVTTPADSYDLIRLDDVRAQLGITENGEDEALAHWISQASGAVAKHCNRVLARETISETFRLATRNSDLLLARYPVASIASVIENDEALVVSDYEVHPASGVLTRLRDDTPTLWPPGKIVVSYVAGFALDEVPDDIARAVIMLVQQYRLGTDRDPQERSSTVDGAGSTSVFDGLESSGLSPEVRGLLAEYRKPAGS